jgi:hypothetical protein
MDSEHQIPIWFFIGITLFLYGLIITATGIYGLINPSIEAGIALNHIHAGIWWGAVMTVVGWFYLHRFNPWRKKE